MNQFVKLLKTTGISCTRNIRGFSPQIRGDSDCITSNCEGGFGACECNCDLSRRVARIRHLRRQPPATLFNVVGGFYFLSQYFI